MIFLSCLAFLGDRKCIYSSPQKIPSWHAKWVIYCYTIDLWFFWTDFGIPEDAIQTIFKELFLSLSFSSCGRYFPLLFRGSLLSAWTLSADPLSSSIWLNSVNGKWLPEWGEWGMRWEWFISLASLWVDHVFYQKSQLLKWPSSYRSPL